MTVTQRTNRPQRPTGMDNLLLRHDSEYLSSHDTVQRFYFKGQLSTHERAIFWEDRRHWFAQKGYSLYAFKDGVPSRHSTSDASVVLKACYESPHQLPEVDPSPYAFVTGTTINGTRNYEIRTNVRARVSE